MSTRMAEHIAANMGSMLIGVIVSAVFLGVSLVQTFFYYTTYPKDAWYLKWIVGATAVFDTVHLVVISHTMWHYLISNYNKPQELQFVVWSIVIEALFTGFTACIVQCFYVTRVYLLSNKNMYLTGFVLSIVLAGATMGTVWVILAIKLKTYDDLLSISPVTNSINALTTTADVIIASSLCFMLQRARTGFKRSDTMINRLMLFVVNTGVLTSICAIASLIALIISPYTLIYATFYFCIGRLYTNSFLATLNARNSMTSDTGSLMLMSMPTTLIASSSGGKSSQNIAIRIDTTHERDQATIRSRHQGPDNLDNKVYTDDELTQPQDTPPRSAAKERESREYKSEFVI